MSDYENEKTFAATYLNDVYPLEPVAPVEAKEKVCPNCNHKSHTALRCGVLIATGSDGEFTEEVRCECLNWVAEPKPTPSTPEPEIAIRVNDKPPIHWKENDGWKRHPQTAEEWNWHDDHAGEGSQRSELRLNFACDLADPHAPDQMAQVLRIDLLRIMARMQSAEAYKKYNLTLKPQPDSSSIDWEQEIKDVSIAVIEGREIPDVSKNVVIRNMVWAIRNRTEPKTELPDSSSISTEPTFEQWWAEFGPTEGNASFRGREWAYNLMKNLCEKAWNAAKGQSDGR